MPAGQIRKIALENADSIETLKDRAPLYRAEEFVFDAAKSLSPAAVLLLVHEKRETILFTVRSERLRQHGGQIGFPGGRVETGESHREAALCETQEELGIPANEIEILGELDRYQSISDYYVETYVGIWREQTPPIPNNHEISLIFEAPVVFFLLPENCRREIWVRGGLQRDMFVWDFDSHRIWGLTGRILSSFYKMMTGRELAGDVPVSKTAFQE